MLDPWHRLSAIDAADELRRACQQAWTDNAPRRGRALEFSSLFEGCQLSSFVPSGYNYGISNVFNNEGGRVIRHKCRSVVKAAHALLWGNDDPLPMVRSVGGDWSTQMRAVWNNRFLDAEYELPQGRFDDTHDMQRHAGLVAMAATGSAAIFELPGYGKVESRFNDTLTMQLETSGPNGTILGCIGTDYYDPWELLDDDRYKHAWDSIKANAMPMRAVGTGGFDQQQSERAERMVVPVHFGYRARNRGKDGRCLWVLRDGTPLVKMQEYGEDELPCAFWHFEREMAGDWGTPLTLYIYELCRRQNELTAETVKRQRNMPQAIVQGTAKMRERIKGKIGSMIWVDSDMKDDDVRVDWPPTYSDSAMAFAAQLSEWADQDSMVDQAHQGGPQRLASSGKHEQLRASYFSEAFAPESRRITHFRTVALGKRKLRALRAMLDEDQDISRLWEKGSLKFNIDGSDLELDEDRFVLRFDAVSEEKNSLQTLLERAERWVEEGKGSVADLMWMYQTADTESLSDQATRDKQWLEEQLEKWLHAPDDQLLEEGFYQSPRKWLMDLEGMARRVSGEMNLAESRGAPPERLEFFEIFLEELAILIDQEKAQAVTSISATADAGGVFPGLEGGANGGASSGGGGVAPGNPGDVGAVGAGGPGPGPGV
jgi:hypothetical protein